MPEELFPNTKENFWQKKVELAPGGKGAAFYSALLSYRNLTKPQKNYMSVDAKVDSEGKAIPSFFLDPELFERETVSDTESAGNWIHRGTPTRYKYPRVKPPKVSTSSARDRNEALRMRFQVAWFLAV